MATTLQEDKLRPMCLYTSIDVKVKTNMALIAALYFVRDLQTSLLKLMKSASVWAKDAGADELLFAADCEGFHTCPSLPTHCCHGTGLLSRRLKHGVRPRAGHPGVWLAIWT